jgi:glyoxylase-like metal-dependent hydrolase (beta-lactamase superfamily II)
MFFEQIPTSGCLSYVIGCADTCAAAVIDANLAQADRYKGIAAREGLTIKYVIDTHTHTHADHFSAAKPLAAALGAHVVMHRDSPAPFADMRLDDGDMLAIGGLRLQALHTPGHTRDSMCLVAGDRVFTGDSC